MDDDQADAAMASLSRFLPVLPATRRTYSVFSKAGGGRYFNSSKPPAGANSGNPKPDRAPVPAPSIIEDESAAQASTSSALPAEPPFTQSIPPRAPYPSLKPQDLRLHQFFSLHRPLLQLSEHPASVFESAPPAALAAFPHTPAAPHEHDSFVEAEPSPEADADAARQLARALVMNNVGPTVAFEDALRRLGLDMSEGREGPEVEDFAHYGIYMDSVKRKRRSKMKKHK